MKTLKQLLEKTTNGYEPKPKDEKRFVDKHVVVKTADANGNKDDVFNATNVKEVDREKEGHGYKAGQDEAVYEQKGAKSLSSILEKKLTPAELKKREEVAKAIERENPGMDKSKKMAIATATAKKVAEEVESDIELVEDQIVQFINDFYSQLDDENKKVFEELTQEQDVEQVLAMIEEVLSEENNG